PVVQLVEHRSPKPGVGGSSPSWPAKFSRRYRGSGVSVMSEKAETQSGTSALEAVKWLVVALLVGVAVWGNSYYGDVSPLYRALAVGALGLAAAFVALQTIQGRAFN